MSAPRLLLLDNVDSFTFMLADYLKSAGAIVDVVRSHAIGLDDALAMAVDGYAISPGPGSPDDAGISVALASACIDRRIPLLGVCLGHQAIARACGQPVERTHPVHGKIARIRHDGSGVFAGLASPMSATRYHSLAVAEPAPPLIASAWSEDGTVMGMHHARAPVHGVQFHPESVASEHGLALLANFLSIAAHKA